VAYQFPCFLLLLSALIGGVVILTGPRDRLWMTATVAALAVTSSMVVSYISISV
jgi:hypothetical protein